MLYADSKTSGGRRTYRMVSAKDSPQSWGIGACVHLRTLPPRMPSSTSNTLWGRRSTAATRVPTKPTPRSSAIMRTQSATILLPLRGPPVASEEETSIRGPTAPSVEENTSDQWQPPDYQEHKHKRDD